ncbi:MAG: purine-nucleoside phosphorylase [Clostridia bacterium]|nr:purine-nucleoside phosphorylase [Clostridia bacterium]
MESLNERVLEAVSYIRTRVSCDPDIGIILGSGLGDLAYKIIDPVEISYADIPYFKSSTVAGHEGKLIFGKIYGKDVVAMKGRLHYYEGYSMEDITFPLRVLTILGVSKLIVTNAAGAINKKFKVGDMMLITDHLNMSGDSPLIGRNCDVFGTRFPSMNNVYSTRLRSIMKDTASKLKINFQEGVYAFMPGPQYETKAEVKMLSLLGADAVGMSTVPEVIVSAHSGVEVLGISCITNATGAEDVSHEEVLAAVSQTTEILTSLVIEFINRL